MYTVSKPTARWQKRRPNPLTHPTNHRCRPLLQPPPPPPPAPNCPVGRPVVRTRLHWIIAVSGAAAAAAAAAAPAVAAAADPASQPCEWLGPALAAQDDAEYCQQTTGCRRSAICVAVTAVRLRWVPSGRRPWRRVWFLRGTRSHFEFPSHFFSNRPRPPADVCGRRPPSFQEPYRC